MRKKKTLSVGVQQEKRKIQNKSPAGYSFAKVISLMNWNPNYRYKLLGKLIRSGDEVLFIFDLTTPEIFMRTSKEGEKPRVSRTAIYPSEWQNQFESLSKSIKMPCRSIFLMDMQYLMSMKKRKHSLLYRSRYQSQTKVRC